MFSGLSNSYSQTACVDLGSQGKENTTQASESLTLFGLAVSNFSNTPPADLNAWHRRLCFPRTL